MPWTADDLPAVDGRTVVVTGATSGLGEAATIALATRGAHVVLATRSAEKTAALMDRIHHRVPSASMEHLPLDLADLASVAVAADRLRDRHPSIDAIMANAGIMAPPRRQTVDGFELQIGVNHLGHFALIGRILPLLTAAPSGRVVVVSSGMHRIGRIDPETLNADDSRYRRWLAYGSSKLANLLHVLELQRRLGLAGSRAIAVGAHPGWTRTGLQQAGPTMQGGISGRVTGALSGVANAVAAQPASRGVLPLLYAAAAPDVPGGSYWGPDGAGEMRGFPAEASRSESAHDPVLARRLWEASEALTGVAYPLPVDDAADA